MVKTGDFVHKGKLIDRIEQPAQTADTQMTRYNIDLTSNDRDAAQIVHQYNAKRQQEITQKNIYSSYEGIVDEVMVQEGNIISAGSPICSVRITQDKDELSSVFYISVDNGKRVEHDNSACAKRRGHLANGQFDWNCREHFTISAFGRRCCQRCG